MDRDRFEQLALEHLDAVHRLAFHLTRDPERADELVQETYAKAFRPGVVERFELPETASEDGTGGMRSWLFTIAHNTFYTMVKKENRAPTAVGEFYADADDGPAPDEPSAAWDLKTFDWEHVDGRLKSAIDELKDQHREILLMWGIEGLKYREIAEILEVPIGTVMSRLHRARKLVMDNLLADEQAAEQMGLRPGSDESEAVP